MSASRILRPPTSNAEIRIRAELAALRTRVEALERTAPSSIALVDAAPDNADGKDGSIAGQGGVANLIWLKLDGDWKSVAVT